MVWLDWKWGVLLIEYVNCFRKLQTYSMSLSQQASMWSKICGTRYSLANLPVPVVYYEMIMWQHEPFPGWSINTESGWIKVNSEANTWFEISRMFLKPFLVPMSWYIILLVQATLLWEHYYPEECPHYSELGLQWHSSTRKLKCYCFSSPSFILYLFHKFLSEVWVWEVEVLFQPIKRTYCP